ncbi:hypothetical protein [Apilactobacillus micheneri]|uniref:hypothetical protein n=1 Tax=Apilactobacillus micheneri TaxID=1899430 RepID=UPI000D5117C6|nr:hypothetical protein [Apilactobacillus micheneri]GAY79850.1 hypothetical protein NBRC113063_00714 [Apilactobacillus micheneri]
MLAQKIPKKYVVNKITTLDDMGDWNELVTIKTPKGKFNYDYIMSWQDKKVMLFIRDRTETSIDNPKKQPYRPLDYDPMAH